MTTIYCISAMTFLCLFSHILLSKETAVATLQVAEMVQILKV